MSNTTTLKPWREVAHPRGDVLRGTFQQSEFAADLSAVATGKAPEEYLDAEKFFARTFITAGMAQLLVAVARRLTARGSEPVVQLKTAFGGGKTHTLLAVWHLARRECDLARLKDVPSLIDRAGLGDVPRANVAVLDGTALAPGQARKHGGEKGREVRTLWGELAWQLGGAGAFAKVAESDAAGTSPGKDVLREVLAAAAPCVVLVDELVAYTRQFANGAKLAGGTFESNMSFVQALTEAVKQVPDAVLLASLPESDREAGGERGIEALKTLEHIFGRVEAIWRTTSEMEAFEIVRRRLFEDVGDDAVRDAVCEAFAALYRKEMKKEKPQLPEEAGQDDYARRLAACYPIHPEVFDRLYQDWAELASFQRTRGVLKLMAKAIHQLWQEDNRDLLIMPGSLPLGGAGVEDEFVRHLAQSWNAVIAQDVKGAAEVVDGRVTRFGEQLAAKRVARTLFLGTAPASVALRAGAARGLDERRVLLGCLQPDKGAPAVFTEALKELANQCHYLYAEGGRFWFDVRPTLRRVMEEKKQHVSEADVLDKIRSLLAKFGCPQGFDGTHVFTPHGDVPDDGKLRLVFLPPDVFYHAKEERAYVPTAREYLMKHGNSPRISANRLLFVAAENVSLNRLRDAVRTALAWEALGDEARAGRLTVTNLQQRQIDDETAAVEKALPRTARETWRWLLCPVQAIDGKETKEPVFEAEKLDTAAGNFGEAVTRACEDHEWVIARWSPVHLRDQVLRKVYWPNTNNAAVGALAVWNDMGRYLYLPRLRDRNVFEAAVTLGAASRDYFGLARGEQQTRGDDGATMVKYEGFSLGSGEFVQVDDTLLLIAPEMAAAYDEKLRAEAAAKAGATQPNSGGGIVAKTVPSGASAGASNSPQSTPPEVWRHFHGTAVLSKTASSKLEFGEIYNAIIAHLAKNPNAEVTVTLEIDADFRDVPGGADKVVKRTVAENAATLKLKSPSWE